MGVPENRHIILKTTTAVIVGLALVWAYWPTLEGLSNTWTNDPNYSQGFLIPILALAILCQRLWVARPIVGKPEPWGLALLLLATLLRLVGAYYYLTALDHLSLLLVLPAFALLLGGRVFLLRAWPAFAFLVFMIPIPGILGGTALIGGLQDLSTAASTFTLQSLGQVAYREGNVILLKETELGVVEACAGVRMLMVFCAMATTTAILLPYGWKRRTILIASAVPLAIICNIARITVAGLASQSLGSEWGHYVFHDLAGFVMVPLAFALLGAEILLLGRLFKTGSVEAPVLDLSTMVALQGSNLPPSVAGAG